MAWATSPCLRSETPGLVARATSSSFPFDVLFGERFGLLVEKPAGHVRGLALGDGDDDVAVKGPAVLAVGLPGGGGVVGVTELEADDDLAFGGGGLFGLHQGEGVDREAAALL